MSNMNLFTVFNGIKNEAKKIYYPYVAKAGSVRGGSNEALNQNISDMCWAINNIDIEGS